MKTKLFLLGMCIVAASMFEGCKKGEDDPGISFRCRKGRVAGEWKMVDFKYTDTDASGISTLTSNGATYTYTDPSGSNTGSWTWDATFEKDGTYKTTEIQDGVTTTTEGLWNFTGGIGDLKKKSQITFYETKYTSPATSNTYSGNYVDYAMDLKELRNKKMVWYYKVTSTSPSGTSTFEQQVTFEAK